MVQLDDESLLVTSYAWMLLPEEGVAHAKGSLHPVFGWKFTFLGGYLMRSFDAGRSWEGPILPPQLDDQATYFPGVEIPAMNRGAMIQGSDGRLYWAVATAPRERVVLMPVRGKNISQMELSAYRAAIAQELNEKYDVFTGDEVDRKIDEIFAAESREALECDTTKCFQEVAIAFQAELIATSMVLPKADRYLLRLEIINILDNKVLYARSEPCEACNETDVINTLKAMARGTAARPVTVKAEKEKKGTSWWTYALGLVLLGGLGAAAGSAAPRLFCTEVSWKRAV